MEEISMRKVTFKIDDQEYFKRELEKENCSREQVQNILKGLGTFKAIYTLYGNGNDVDKYTLTDHDGNKININDLNGYEKGVVLNDCHAYFTGSKYYDNADKPYGIVRITEEKI